MFSLKTILRANAASCLVFGALFALLPSQVTIFLGGSSPAPDVLVLIIGIVLIVNGLHLTWASTIPLPRKELILYFSIGDFIWVIASIGLIITGLWITSVEGVLSTIAIAIMVGIFGILQMIYRKAMGEPIKQSVEVQT